MFATLCLAALLASAATPVQVRGAPGMASFDGGFRCYATCAPIAPPASLAPTWAWTPVYPASERAACEGHISGVDVEIDPKGNVRTAWLTQTHLVGKDHDLPGAFDSVAVGAAREWRFAASTLPARHARLAFRFAVRTPPPEGEGDLVVTALEPVSLDPLSSPTISLPESLWVDRVGNRYSGIPAGEYTFDVFGGLLFGGKASVHARIRRGKTSKVTAVLVPDRPIPPGHTYVMHPPAALPARPGDDARFPLAGFRLVYEGSHSNRVDTAKGLLTKDLVSFPDTTITFHLSDAEMDRIRQAMIAMRFWDPLSPLAPGEQETGFEPWGAITATAGGVTVTRAFGMIDLLDSYPSDEWKRTRDLSRFIEQIVHARPEYRALPAAQGAYL